MADFLLPIVGGIATGALASVGAFNMATLGLNDVGWHAAGNYIQLGASYGLVTAAAVGASAYMLGRGDYITIAAGSGAVMAGLGYAKVDPQIMKLLGNPGYGLEGGSNNVEDKDFMLYRFATAAIMAGASTAVAQFGLGFLQ
jgi:hypothetical protein